MKVVAFFMLAAGSAFAASDPMRACPDFPVPKKVKLQAVAQQLDFNGVPMVIRRLESEEPAAALVAFYREKWAATDKIRGPAEYALGPWQVIATLREVCFYTVQYKAFGKGGTEALLGISAPPAENAVKEAVPMLPGSIVINDLGHNDAGKTARTVLLKNGFSTAANTDFYLRNLTEEGWRVTSHHRVDQPNRDGDVVILKNGKRELSDTATRQGRESNVLLHYVDQP
jgi:hypothetical protein